MGDKARVKEHLHLVKDLDTFSILNTDRSVLAKHNEKMAQLKRNKELDKEINTMKSEISEIKSMLSQILRAVDGEK